MARNIVPRTNKGADLGTPAKNWNTVYADSVIANNVQGGNLGAVEQSAGDEVTLRSLIANAGSNPTSIMVYNDIHITTTDLTIPSNIYLHFKDGGKLSPANGVTLTINGPIEAGLWQIFGGAGTVTGNPKVGCVYPEWFGAIGDGSTDDTGAMQNAIDAFSTTKLFLSLAPKTYRLSSTLNINGKGSEAPAGIICQSGTAKLDCQAPDVGIKINGLYASGDSAWFWLLENLFIKGSSPTLLQISGGDTWHGCVRRVWFEGSSGSQLVSLTNNNINAYRDYFVLFERCVFRNGDYSVVIGGDWSSGSLVKCKQAVNRVKITDCDFYGYCKYGIYICDTDSGDSCNGHTFKGLHFDSAGDGAVADIYLTGVYSYIEACHESGADHAIHFKSWDVGGDIICNSWDSYRISRFKVGNDVLDDTYEPFYKSNTNYRNLSLLSPSPNGYVNHSHTLDTNTILGHNGLNLETDEDIEFFKIDRETRDEKNFMRLNDQGASFYGHAINSLKSAIGEGTDSYVDIDLLLDDPAYYNNTLGASYLLTVHFASSPSKLGCKHYSVLVQGDGTNCDYTEISSNSVGSNTTTITITRPTPTTLRVAWTGYQIILVAGIRTL